MFFMSKTAQVSATCSTLQRKLMKKSLIALAALAFVGAASAQSSVTLYGVADYWIGNVKGTGWTSASGGLAPSRIGFRGVEDVGGGNTIGFTFEEGIDIGNGNNTTGGASNYNRRATINMTSSLGEIQLGQSTTVYDDVVGAKADGFDSAFATYGTVWVNAYTVRPGRNTKLILPSFGPFSVSASASANNSVRAIQANYSEGPIYAGIAIQNQKPGAVSTRSTLLTGAYDLGVAELLGNYSTVKNPGAGSDKANEFQFGVNVPIDNQLTVSAGYAQSQLSLAGVDGQKTTGFSVSAGYSLTSRTVYYGGLRSSKVKGGATGRLVAVGVNHSF
jgi:predicted porin